MVAPKHKPLPHLEAYWASLAVKTNPCTCGSLPLLCPTCDARWTVRLIEAGLTKYDATRYVEALKTLYRSA